MQLVTARIRMFRNIIDSGDIDFQADVTSLVGKNESGKTSVLEALHRLRPAVAEIGFEAQRDYPRWRYTRDRKAGVIEATVPVSATFTLDDEDLAAVEAGLWPRILAEPSFRIDRTYGGRSTRYVQLDDAAAVRGVLAELSIDSKSLSELEAQPDLAALVSLCQSKMQAKDDGLGDYADVLEAVEAKAPGGNLRKAVADLLASRIPRFFYFSDYETLPSRINLAEVSTTEPELTASTPQQTARALLRLAGADQAAIKDEDFEARKSELEATSNELTRQVFEYWTQNQNLSVEIDAEKEVVNNGYNSATIVKYLQVRVKDSRHGFTGSFGQRSKGFQWFFSFFAAFSEFEDQGRSVIVLLDEPALSLHGRAQGDFLRFINERLAAQTQVVYTTHSPFMVEPSHLERVRLVEDKGPDVGAVVTKDVQSVGEDATFPLQAALGYDLAQNLLVGPDNLLLEGGSDATYLRIMSEHLRTLGREGLDPRWRIISTHGATNMPTFVSLFGELDVTLLVDGTSRSTPRLEQLILSGGLRRKQVLSTDDHAPYSPSDIEDLFSAAEYLKLYNEAFGSDLKARDLIGKDRIIARIGRAEGRSFVQHGKPAETLLRWKDRGRFLRQLSGSTIDRWEALFKSINERLA